MWLYQQEATNYVLVFNDISKKIYIFLIIHYDVYLCMAWADISPLGIYRWWFTFRCITAAMLVFDPLSETDRVILCGVGCCYTHTNTHGVRLHWKQLLPQQGFSPTGTVCERMHVCRSWPIVCLFLPPLGQVNSCTSGQVNMRPAHSEWINY